MQVDESHKVPKKFSISCSQKMKEKLKILSKLATFGHLVHLGLRLENRADPLEMKWAYRIRLSLAVVPHQVAVLFENGSPLRTTTNLQIFQPHYICRSKKYVSFVLTKTFLLRCSIADGMPILTTEFGRELTTPWTVLQSSLLAEIRLERHPGLEALCIC